MDTKTLLLSEEFLYYSIFEDDPKTDNFNGAITSYHGGCDGINQGRIYEFGDTAASACYL